MISRFRFVVPALVLALVVSFGLSAGPGMAKTKRLKPGKEGQYSQAFTNGTSMWQDDTSVSVWVRSRKVVGIWVTANFKLAGGGFCAPFGYSGTLMPDGSLTGPVSLQMKTKRSIPLNSKNRFVFKPTEGNPFTNLKGGSITGTLLPSGRMSVVARLTQGAIRYKVDNGDEARWETSQGVCSTVLKAPKLKFTAMKVSSDFGP